MLCNWFRLRILDIQTECFTEEGQFKLCYFCIKSKQMDLTNVEAKSQIPKLIARFTSNIYAKPLFSDTREKHQELPLHVHPSGWRQSLCWVTDLWGKEGNLLLSHLLPHHLVSTKSSDATWIFAAALPLIFFFPRRTDERERKIR